MLRRQAVIQRADLKDTTLGQAGADAPVRIRPADHEGATMQIEQLLGSARQRLCTRT